MISDSHLLKIIDTQCTCLIEKKVGNQGTRITFYFMIFGMWMLGRQHGNWSNYFWKILGAHTGSQYRNLVAHTCNLGVPGCRAPARQQPWSPIIIILLFEGSKLLRANWLQCHAFIFPSATILKCLNSMLGHSLTPGQLPFVNLVYDLGLSSTWKYINSTELYKHCRGPLLRVK